MIVLLKRAIVPAVPCALCGDEGVDRFHADHRSRPSTIRHVVGLVGRRAELAALRERFTAASKGSCSALLLEGEPGIGKSTLLHAAVDEARARGMHVLVGGITEAESIVSWAGLSSLLDGVDDDAAEMVEQHLEEGHLLPARIRWHRNVRGVDAAEVAALFASLVSAMAASSPTLLAVDDLQWLDRGSAAAITTAIRSNLDRSVAVVGACRRGTPLPIDLGRIPRLPLARLRLQGLSVGGVFQLLAEHGFNELRRPDMLRIFELSQGNPLFALELARLHREGRTVGAFDELDALQSLIVARLDRLDQTAIDTARFCALLARPMVPIVRRVMGPPADDALLRLEREGIIVCDGDHLTFAHPLLREGVLVGLGSLERRDYHRRIADCIDDPERAVVHRGEATDLPDAELAAALERIADEALAHGAPDVAQARYRRAEALTPSEDVADRWRRAHRAVRCLRAIGSDELVLDEAMRLFETAPADFRLAAALDVLESTHRVHGVDAAAAWIPACRSRLADSPADELAFLERAVRVEQVRDASAAAALAGDALELASSIGDRALIDRTRALGASTALLAGEPVDVDTLPDLDPDPLVAGLDATMVLAELLVWTLRTERAEAALRPMEVAARTNKRRAQLIRVLAQLGDLHLRSGDWGAAANELAEAVELELTIGYEAGAQADLAWLEAARGRAEVANELIESAARALSTAPGVYRMHVLARRGFVHLAGGRWAAAANDLALAQAEADAVGLVAVTALPLAPDRVEALAQLGQVEEARHIALVYEQAAARAASVFDQALARRCLALVAGAAGHTREAACHAEAALELHDQGPPAVFEVARTRLVAGSTLRRLGRKRDARVLVEAALETFEMLRALPFVHRAAADLERLRTRRASTSLTSTERRVAELAGKGRTNAEIASELVISVRTVESNLTRVYRKLGVRSRAELAAYLAATG
jgi:DNA-binding CsgD family transcriptional regulator